MSTDFTRRTFIVGAGVVTTFGLLGTPVPAFAEGSLTATQGPLTATQLLDRRRAQITGSAALTAMAAASPAPWYKSAIDQHVAEQSNAAKGLLSSMQTGTSSTLPWSDLPVDSASTPDTYKRSDNLTAQFVRLQQIARAYATPGTSSYRVADVAAKVVRGLDVLIQNHYSSTHAVYGNWWCWEIGIPGSIVETLTLLGAGAPSSTVAAAVAAARYYAPYPGRRGRSATGMAETGANLADKSLITSLRGLLDGTTADIIAGRDALSGGRILRDRCSSTSPRGTASTRTDPSSSTGRSPTSALTAWSPSVGSLR